MLEQFSATVQKIYAAGSGTCAWQDALATVEELTGSAGAVVNVIAKDDMTQSFVLNGPRLNNHFSAEAVDEYNRELLPYCPRIAAGMANPDLSLVCDYMLLSEAEMDRNVAYEWYGRHDLRYFIGAPLGQTERYKLMWSVQRTPAQGHAQDADLELFELLKPHFARALVLADELGTLRRHERFSSAVLEALPDAVFALDGEGTVLFANRAAELVLQSGDGVACERSKLRARLHAERDQLDRLIREAAVLGIAGAGGWVRVSRLNGGPPYAAYVAPLNCGDEELLTAQTRVLVIVHDTAQHRAAEPNMLMQIYALTDAEARLASALSAGHSIESAAANLGVQPTTARSQLKSVFRKVGVNRQQDLVRVLSSLPAKG